MQNIAFIDLKAQQQRLKDQIDARMQAVLEHGRFIMGPEVAELEQTLCDFSGARHTIGVSNGTDALLMALMAEGIGRGDAVFLPSFTFTATAEVVLLLGATPVFVEVDGEDFNIDLADLRAKVEATLAAGKLAPRAIIPVDLFGLPVDYAQLNELAEEFSLFVIADAAQSFGASYEDRKVGALAHATTTSFFPAKPLGCFGDGGAVFTDDDERAAIYRSIRAHGKGTAKYDITRVGLNARLDTLQAAVLLAKMTVFGEEIESRNKIAARYNAALAGVVKVPQMPNNKQSAWAQYSILVENRDELAAALKEKNVPSAVYYPLPMHLQSAYTEFGDGKGSLPVSEGLSGTIMSLPMHPYLDEETQDYICNAVIEAAG